MDIILILFILTLLAATLYILVHSHVAPADPYGDFDLWQAAFNDGMEAAHVGLTPADNQFEPGTPQADAWDEGWELASIVQPQQPNSEVA